MKKKQLLPFWLFSLLMIGGCSFESAVPENEFLIKGKLTNVLDSVILELLKTDGQK